MLSMKLFNLLYHLTKEVRKGKSSQVFGGIQVIMGGDFFQLPPVGRDDDPDTKCFCFESPFWDEVFPAQNQIQLKKIFRQKDNEYASILNQIRVGAIERKSVDVLSSLVGKDMSHLEFIPTKLFPTRKLVDTFNNDKLSFIEDEAVEFVTKNLTNIEIKSVEDKRKRRLFTEEDINIELLYMRTNILCDEKLTLKVGSQVMCVVNLDLENGICNGSQGIVKEIDQEIGTVKVKFNNGIIMNLGRHVWESEKIPGVGVSQIPLILAWAISIHKSQGSTLDMAEIDIGSQIFECGQSYVALSRVKTLEGLFLSSFDVGKIRVNSKVKRYYSRFE